MIIIPAILTNDIKDVEEKIKAVGAQVERVQIDILDGEFAGNRTVGLEDINNLSIEGVEGLELKKIDIHLMVKEPVDWIEGSAQAKADRVIGQIEMMSNQMDFVNEVLAKNMLAGLAIDLGTPVSSLDQTILPELDVILLMAVKAGFQNQEFEESVLDKIREIKEMRENQGCNFKICIDGGVEVSNIKMIKDVGADEVVCGSSLFSGDIEENLKEFKNEIY